MQLLARLTNTQGDGLAGTTSDSPPAEATSWEPSTGPRASCAIAIEPPPDAAAGDPGNKRAAPFTATDGIEA